jgi:hypothetical protein
VRSVESVSRRWKRVLQREVYPRIIELSDIAINGKLSKVLG